VSEGGFTRRSLIRGGAVAGVGVAAGVGIASAADRDSASPDTKPLSFHGTHQPGIATAQQDRLVFASYDLLTDSKDDLQAVLKLWSEAAATLMAKGNVGAVAGQPLAPPDDTGEAHGLKPSRLTITIGLGPTLFAKDGKDRLGLMSKQPKALKQIPALPGDELNPDKTGGDLCIQACADDPQVAFHAVRNLTRIARQYVQLRWTQIGFGRTSSTSRAQDTPRNLLGFKDGTANIVAEDKAAMAEHVWVGSEGAWMQNGSYLVARRISMLIEVWDRSSLQDQEQTIGRTKVEGAPIGKAKERDTLDLSAKGADGLPTIPADSHVRLAAPSQNGGVSILRRGYSFTDGMSADLGQLDAGLFFISYQRNPSQFEALQRRLGALDKLNEYIKHVGSAVFAVPPGAAAGSYVGAALFA
jgi:deferrochelatase/peroxidase EfeB